MNRFAALKKFATELLFLELYTGNDTVDLVKSFKPTFKELRTLVNLSFVEDLIVDLVSSVFLNVGEHDIPSKPEYYASIRYDLDQFTNEMKEHFGVGSYYLRNFLDIGSCNGEKLFVAKEVFGIKKVAGIEVSPESVEYCNKFFGKDSGIDVYNQDAFDSVNIISQFNNIYMYCPIRVDDKMIELVNFILKNMGTATDDGAQLMEVLPVWAGKWVMRYLPEHYSMFMFDDHEALVIRKYFVSPGRFKFQLTAKNVIGEPINIEMPWKEFLKRLK